ncbi:MAG: MFS transporter [Nitrososphaerales archaeon]|jgi:MFS family permease
MSSTKLTVPEKKPGRGAWVLTLLPLNAGVQGFSTMVPLYILSLGGSVVDVALITTVYNFVLIPSSIFWGRMTDRLARRRFFFVVTCSGCTAIFILMFLIPYLGALAVLYAALGFVIGANSASTNLLVMETSEKKNWISSFSRLNLIANVGSIIGLAVGFVWTSALPLGAFLIFCGGATAVAILITYLRIPEPAIPLETAQLTFHPSGYFARIYHGMTVMVGHLVLSPPSAKEVLRALRATRAGAMTGRALLFLSTFLFTTSSALLNTSFTPFLSQSGVVYNEIFVVSLVNTVLQTGIYRWASDIINRFGGVRLGSYAVLVRAALYMVFAASALAFRGFPLFVVASVFYGLIGGVYAVWNSATSVTLMSNLGQVRQGNLLGGYAALGALGTVTGSLFTGYISYYQGYSTTFTTAAAVMLVSFFVLEASLKSFGYTKRQPKGPEETAPALAS